MEAFISGPCGVYASVLRTIFCAVLTFARHDGRLVWVRPLVGWLKCRLIRCPLFRRGRVWMTDGILMVFSARNYIHIFFGRCAAEINRLIKWRGDGSVYFSTRVSHSLGAHREAASCFVCQGF